MNLIDLSRLPAPTIVEPLDFETILAELVADYKARYPEHSADLESDPAYKLLETVAYRELSLRQQFNDRAKGVLLAYAWGANLDQLAALQNVGRLLVDPGDPDAMPPVPPTYEADERLRQRVQLAPEGFSTAGPTGAYEFHGFSADADVLDIDVFSPSAGEVVVTVLSAVGNGTPGQALLDAVEAALSARNVRPLTDQVTVQGATIVNYSIAATLYFYDGPDPEVVRQAAASAVASYAAEHHRLGHDITLSGLFAALHQPGVQRVALASPAADVAISTTQASWCTSISVVSGGSGE